MALQIQLYIKYSTKESEGSGYEEASGYEDDENNLESPGEDYRCVFQSSHLFSNLAFYRFTKPCQHVFLEFRVDNYTILQGL